MSGKQRLLIVEDEPAIRRGLADVFAHHGFEVRDAATGEEGLREGLSGNHDLIVLDLMLPGISGFDVCERVRAEHPRLPILMLTARGAEDDILRGFRAGADDYVTKPFSLAQLLARVKALLRRAGDGAVETLAPFRIGALTIDPARLLACDGDARVELTRREVELLALLAEERGRIVSRRTLLRLVWRFERADHLETRTVDMHVAKLRKKLGAARDLIETVRGEGYRLLA
jgi:two-component system response regulator RegX3